MLLTPSSPDVATPSAEPQLAGQQTPLALCRRHPRNEPVLELVVNIPGSQGAWRWQFLGPLSTLTQRTIDQAVATLDLRADHWRALTQRGPIELRHQRELLHLRAGPHAPAQCRLLRDDVASWSGRGQGIAFITLTRTI